MALLGMGCKMFARATNSEKMGYNGSITYTTYQNNFSEEIAFSF
jgi:hypothetical protein